LRSRKLSSTRLLLLSTQEWYSGQPLLSIKEVLIPHGCTEDAAACKANLEPLDAAGVTSALLVVHTNADKLDGYKSDNNDGIIAVGDVPPQPPYASFIVNDTDDKEIAGSNGAGSNNN
jgi:hypothetical protein